MGLFNRKKVGEPKPSVADMLSSFMNDDSEGDHGKEAMLDYQLSYLLRMANTYESGSELAKRVLMKMIGKIPKIDSYGWIENLRLKSVKVWKQWQRIDLIAEVEANCGSGMKRHAIIVENKAYTGIHDDQLSRYAEIIEDYYKDKDVQKHYWVITFFDSDTENYKTIETKCREAKGPWKCTSFKDLIDLTKEERHEGTYNEIIDEFWIKRWS